MIRSVVVSLISKGVKSQITIVHTYALFWVSNCVHYTYNSRNVIVIAVLWALGNTGDPSTPKDTTIMRYVTPSVSPVTVIIVLVVFPALSLSASLVV